TRSDRDWSSDVCSSDLVGDSRAYWLPEDGEPQLLTADDSLAGQMAAAGAQPAEIAAHQSAGALVRWLGADAPDSTPHLRMFTPRSEERRVGKEGRSPWT